MRTTTFPVKLILMHVTKTTIHKIYVCYVYIYSTYVRIHALYVCISFLLCCSCKFIKVHVMYMGYVGY